jgi:hypothetical protein
MRNSSSRARSCTCCHSHRSDSCSCEGPPRSRSRAHCRSSRSWCCSSGPDRCSLCIAAYRSQSRRHFRRTRSGSLTSWCRFHTPPKCLRRTPPSRLRTATPDSCRPRRSDSGFRSRWCTTHSASGPRRYSFHIRCSDRRHSLQNQRRRPACKPPRRNWSCRARSRSCCRTRRSSSRWRGSSRSHWCCSNRSRRIRRCKSGCTRPRRTLPFRGRSSTRSCSLRSSSLRSRCPSRSRSSDLHRSRSSSSRRTPGIARSRTTLCRVGFRTRLDTPGHCPPSTCRSPAAAAGCPCRRDSRRVSVHRSAALPLRFACLNRESGRRYRLRHLASPAVVGASARPRCGHNSSNQKQPRLSGEAPRVCEAALLNQSTLFGVSQQQHAPPF